MRAMLAIGVRKQPVVGGALVSSLHFIGMRAEGERWFRVRCFVDGGRLRRIDQHCDVT